MERILLILPPHKSDFYTYTKPSWGIVRVPPVGLIAVGSYLHAKGYNAKIMDCREVIVTRKTNDYIPFITQAVEDFRPDVIGINILTALFPEAERIARELKTKFPDSLIIAGGVHPSVEPGLTFKQNKYLDGICIGSGEEVALDIMEDKDITAIPGLMMRNQVEKYVKRPVVMDIDKYPFPNFDLVNSKYYTEFTLYTISGWGFKGITAQTSRSCPYSCKFCSSDWSKPVRYHSPEYVVSMAKHLATYDVDVIGLFDDTIASIPSRLVAICEGFIKAKIFYPYTHLRWICAMRANQITPELLQIAKKAGCCSVSIGIESGSDRMLKVLEKKTTVAMNRRACTYVKEAGLHLVVSFMVGIPTETEEEMNETVRFMESLHCNSKGMGCFRPLPGSPFYNEFVADGSLVKEEIDWGNLGDFSAPTKYVYCDMSLQRLESVFDRALNKAAVRSWVAVHQDILDRYPEIITGIASRANVRICKSDNYESSSHIPYKPRALSTIYSIGNSAFLELYAILPYKLRRWIRATVPKVRKNRYLRKWVAQY